MNSMNNMSLLEKKEYYSMLFDFYGSLLTEKQQDYFSEYYFNDLSLMEISTYYNVSRNAVFDQIKKTLKILDDYEEKLHLCELYIKRNNLYDEYNDTCKELITKLKELE